MEWTLDQILESKKLRKKLVDIECFSIKDSNGLFDMACSYRSIFGEHSKIYDRLYELGGDALLDKLFTEGKTCLSNDLSTAKERYFYIRGTDRYFLREACMEEAVDSIFFGIAGWADMSGNFDRTGLTCSSWGEDDVEEDEEEADGEEPEEDDGAEAETPDDNWRYNWFGRVLHKGPAYSYALREKNGKKAFFDKDNDCFVSFQASLAEKLYVEEMTACERLEMADEWCGTKCLGYRYRLEEGGKWGYISTNFLQCIAPIYDGIMVSGDSALDAAVLAWQKQEEDWCGEKRFDLFRSVEVRHVIRYNPGCWGIMEEDHWLPEPVHKVGYSFTGLDQRYLPTERAVLFCDEEGSNESIMWETPTIAWYKPDKEKQRCLLFAAGKRRERGEEYEADEEYEEYEECETGWDGDEYAADETCGYTQYDIEEFRRFPPGSIWLECVEITQEYGFLSLVTPRDTHYRSSCALNRVKRVPAGEMGMFDCWRAFQTEMDFEAVECLAFEDYLGRYIIKRDGYWAVAEVSTWHKPKIKRLLTPYAFTNIRTGNCTDGCVQVERFGKWGVYDWKAEAYVLPCDHKSIFYEKKNYKVCRWE